MAGTLDASRMRKIADNISKTLGVEDDEGVLTDKFLDALAHAEERGSTHPVRADPRFPNVSQVRVFAPQAAGLASPTRHCRAEGGRGGESFRALRLGLWHASRRWPRPELGPAVPRAAHPLQPLRLGVRRATHNPLRVPSYAVHLLFFAVAALLVSPPASEMQKARCAQHVSE